ncbi:MAG: hypothetical protein HS104_19530 [Polyangiaceae bacterium]|nr:hypothetical protein [Polyangiaceae bacterium]MBK8998497.1 hypothetical protein [Myxococcales bacterium]MCL4752550.1 hypothetical protein [Myxococcales bacterium]
MRARSFQGPMVLAASVVMGLLVAWGCGDDENKTPSCPELPLYDVHDASGTDKQAREQAAAAGCVTKPGTATTAAAGAPGGGGSAGAGGSSGGTAGAGGTSDAAAD